MWRAGGAIALAASRGEKVTIACLTFGERGESAKAIRREEAEQAAAALGAEVAFFDAGDYPLIATPELTDRLVAVYREAQPDVVLTHPLEDPYNGDHPAAARMAHGDWGFTAFALAGVSSMIFIGLAALRLFRQPRTGTAQ